VSAVTPEILRDLAARLDVTSADAFARWRDEAGAALPGPLYAPIEGEWRSAMNALEAIRPNPAYDRILEGDLAPATPESVAVADRETLDGFTTHIVRSERFCYGAVGSAHERGLLAAVARRHADLLESA
jgi:hypothetical protein